MFTKVSIEPIIWVIRLGNEHEMYKEFEANCTAIKAGLKTVRLTGMLKLEKTKNYEVLLVILRKKLKELGFDKMIFERNNNGVVEERVYNI